MEGVVRTRLKLIIERLASLIEIGQDTIQKIKNEPGDTNDAQIVASKLKVAIERFVSETYNYFNIVQNPCADEICQYTEVQIKGEELVTELNFYTQKRMTNLTNSSANSKADTLNVASKLPKMELAKFDGDVLKWHQFWDQFASNVDNRNINDVDKLLYLQSVLEGEAKRAIDGLDTTNTNYQIAVSTLKDRYGKPGTIIDAHYAALYRIKTADKSISDCRRVLNEIERHLRVLNSLGEDVNHNHLRVMIMQKFSEEIIYELRVKLGTETDTIENIRKHLEHIISAREASNRMKEDTFQTERPSTSKAEGERFTLETLHAKTEDHPKPRFPPRKQFSFHNHDRGRFQSKRSDNKFHTEGRYSHYANKNSDTRKRQHTRETHNPKEPETKRKRPTCIFCGNGHFNDECNIAKTVQDRKNKLLGRCYNCLSKGHRSADCRSHKKCHHCEKYGDHNRALCPSRDLVKTNNLHLSLLPNNKGLTILQTAVVKLNKIGNNTSQILCRVLLDCGSQRTYVTKDLAEKLKLSELETNNLSVFTFGADHPNEIESPVVNFEMTTRTNKFKTLYANVVPHITNSVPTLPCDGIQRAQTGNIPDKIILADDASLGDRVDLLIGNDYYFALIGGDKLQMADNLFLVDSIFGWIWSGRCPKTMKEELDKLSVLTYFQSSFECSSFCEPDPPLKSDSLKKLWDLESIGITDSPKADRDDEAIKQFNDTIEFFDCRYHVKWPWIEYPPLLPSNFGLSLGRLKSLLKRLDDDTVISYDNIIKEQLDKNIIEIVPNALSSVEHPVHYLPHHCVSQGEKLRLVYDASSKTKGSKSLNECLYRGPLLLEDLTGLLIRFREHRIGLVADVEKAFLQIGLHEKDRDVTRFLWPKNLRDGLSPDNLMHLRFRRVPFGVISSPFLLNATVRYHLNKSRDNVHKLIAQDLYVDNLVTGVESISEAINLYQTSKCAFDELSMNLREWNSNSDEFLNSIPTQYRSRERTHMKVLGLNWDLANDSLSLKFDLAVKDIDQVNTKREVLRLVASVFDPCGFSAPLVLPIKLFLQNLWYQKIEWDTKINMEAMEELKTAIESLNCVNGICVPRSFNKPKETQNGIIYHELHAFADASMQAYAAVVYLRSVNESATELNFVMGKSRLVGKAEQTDLQIPKIELLGVLIGSRLIKNILKSLRINVKKLYLWTDSQIVKSWCNSEKLLPPFIAKRVEEIKRNDTSIRYVPSQLNPADIATRTKASLEDVDRWLKGPDFLYHDISKWPVNISEITNSHDLVHNLSVGQGPPEVSRLDTRRTQSGLPQAKQQDSTQSVDQPDIRCQSNSMDIDSETAADSHVNKLRQIQAECFPKELEGKKTDLVRSLGLYKDNEGILRCGGRLGNTDWPDHQKNPILLPRNHDYTSKLIDKIHRKNYHVGVSQTLSLIRRRYWISKGRAQVQKVLKHCQSCRKYAGGPFKLPPMASLPSERVTYSEAFTYVGIDYFGPLLVDVNGVSVKRWVSLYTCLAVRAIHMEVVADLTAEECLLAMRRFVSSRGVPKLITSDNATQFKLTAEVLTSDYCIMNGIKWKFIPELAPWFGGFYERLIGIVKNCMKRTLDKHLLNHTQLCTVIKEIEAVVNSRPLTVVGDELEHILTPADFLRTGGPSIPETSDRDFLEPATVTKTNLIDGWKRGQKILQEYVQMFVNQYLNCLRERRTTHRQARVVVDAIPKVGNLVQVKGDSNRALWKVGRISAVIQGRDGKIRVAKVATSPNETLTRSIAHLYPLEIQESDDASQVLDKGKLHETKTPVTSECNQIPNSDIRSPIIPDQTHTSPEADDSYDGAQATLDTLDQATASTQSRHTQLRPKRLTAQKAIEKIKVWTSH